MDTHMDGWWQTNFGKETYMLGNIVANDRFLNQVFGVQFKKRAPTAIKEIKKFAFKAMVRRHLSDGYPPGLFKAPVSNTSRRPTGHKRRPRRPATQQEGVGERCQGRAISDPGAHLAEAQRRGRRQGEAVQLRAGSECQEREAPHDDHCG